MTTKPSIHVGGVLLLALALAACQPGDEPTLPETPPGSGSAQPRSGEAISEEPAMSEREHLSLDEAIEAARQDLASRTGTAIGEISVVRAQKVTWANGAMGCPQKGMMYTQALVEGYFILLRSNGEESAYHAGRDGQPFHCPAGRSKAPPAADEKPLS